MEKKLRKLQGNVIKLSSKDTIKIRVETRTTHPIYGKSLKSHKNYLVHVPAEMTEVKVGDVVTVAETKPISKQKHFVLFSIDKA
jgi:small subunit ribosomal protein S17